MLMVTVLRAERYTLISAKGNNTWHEIQKSGTSFQVFILSGVSQMHLIFSVTVRDSIHEVLPTKEAHLSLDVYCFDGRSFMQV